MLLCDLKVNSKVKSREMSLMHYAVQSGNPDCVQLLLDYSIDFDDVTANSHLTGALVIEQGVTPLILACQIGLHDAVRMLVIAGARLDVAVDDYKTPLFYAICKNHVQCVEILLENGGANPNYIVRLPVDEPWSWFCYPLFVAINKNALKCLKVLLRAGSDLGTIAINDNLEPVSCLEFALSLHHYTAVEMLLAAGFPSMVVNRDEFETGYMALASENEELRGRLSARLQSPLSLMEIARLCLREQCMGSRGRGEGKLLKDLLHGLPLPSYLLRYLQFGELEDYLV